MENQTAFENDEQILFENKDILSDAYFSFCPIGWSKLVGQLFKDIRNICTIHKSVFPVVLQVKSKFGGLRFYIDNGSDQWDKNSVAGIEVERLIHEAENKSYTICEITGQPGSRYVKDHFYATLSEKKAKELGFAKREQQRDHH